MAGEGDKWARRLTIPDPKRRLDATPPNKRKKRKLLPSEKPKPIYVSTPAKDREKVRVPRPRRTRAERDAARYFEIRAESTPLGRSHAAHRRAVMVFLASTPRWHSAGDVAAATGCDFSDVHNRIRTLARAGYLEARVAANAHRSAQFAQRLWRITEKGVHIALACKLIEEEQPMDDEEPAAPKTRSAADKARRRNRRALLAAAKWLEEPVTTAELAARTELAEATAYSMLYDMHLAGWFDRDGSHGETRWAITKRGRKVERALNA